jgi:hypothetical protein
VGERNVWAIIHPSGSKATVQRCPCYFRFTPEKVRGTIDGHPFRSAFMAMGGGVHKLPVKAETRLQLGKNTGDVVTVRLTARERK